MKIIVCIDDKNGMMFNHRRQSKDREVRRDMLSYIGQHRLWMNEYSRKQFEAVPKDAQIEVNENFPAFAGDDDYCFIENSIYLLNKNLITEIVIYHWYRIYPSDTKFELDLSEWNLVSQNQFRGFSHEKITREVWKK